MRIAIWLLPLCLFSLTTVAQQQKKWSDLELSSKGLNFLVNSKMQSLVTGPANGTAVASYASFDPANGSFIFKGSTPLTREESKRFVFLSARIEGDLISDSYAVLFKNTALNSGVTGDIQLHYRFKKGIKQFYLFSGEAAKLKADKDLLEKWRTQTVAQIQQSYSDNRTRSLLDQYEFEGKVLEYRATQNSNQRVALIGNLNTELAKLNPTSATVTSYSNALKALEDTAATFSKQLTETRKKIDSVTIIRRDATALSNAIVNRFHEKYRDSLTKIEKNVKLSGVRFTWFTLILGGSKKAYHTFDPNQPFENQLIRHDSSTFRVGLSLNYYSEHAFPRTMFYGNIGAVAYHDNNIKYLSTRQLEQERTLKNAVGDTIRKIKKTYNVYTDPVRGTFVTSLFSNLYFMNDARTMALHLFPSFDFIRNQKDITNIGVGFVTSFKNEKKEKPIINVEGYIKVNDLLNNHPDTSEFWNKNEIGISFSIPINLFN
jgi:hypothetical protein